MRPWTWPPGIWRIRRTGRWGVFRGSLDDTLRQLSRLESRPAAGRFEYRLLDVSPGFSLVAADPHDAGGVLLIEFHGYRNASSGGRMHLALDASAQPHWYRYWIAQFEGMWDDARPPRSG